MNGLDLLIRSYETMREKGTEGGLRDTLSLALRHTGAVCLRLELTEEKKEYLVGKESRGREWVLGLPLRFEREKPGTHFVHFPSPLSRLRWRRFFRAFSRFLSSELGRMNRMRRLLYLGNTDILLRVNNRNAMEERVRELEKRADLPVGLLILDVNGLKEINDREGHDAGDRFLKEAADILASVFGRSQIYRIGGDEFAVIVPGMMRESFQERCRRLKRELEESDTLTAATGFSWKESAAEIQEAKREADAGMYRDKREFYQKHERRGRKKDSGWYFRA